MHIYPLEAVKSASVHGSFSIKIPDSVAGIEYPDEQQYANMRFPIKELVAVVNPDGQAPGLKYETQENWEDTCGAR